MIHSPVSIRFAAVQDMPAVFELICELARYERAETKVKNTIKNLVEDGFGERPAFECLVAEQQGVIVGFALFYSSYSTWRGKCIYLEDLCITETKRQVGIGTLLFDEVIRIARERGMKRLEWQVLEWNEPAICFYKKYDADLDPEWINGKLFFD